MEDESHFTEPLFERLKEYGKTTFELYKLKSLEKTAEIGSSVGTRLIFIFFFLFSFLFGNLGLAFWLGDVLGDTYFGFLCVACFYAFVGVILSLFFANSIKRTISTSIISRFLN